MNNLSLMDMKIQYTPAQFAKALRDMGDVFWWEKGKFWVVNSYEMAKTALLNPDFTCDRSSFFVTRMPDLNLNLVQDFFAVVGKMMVMSDPPEHTNRRRICYHGFTSQYLQQLKPLIQQTIEQAIANRANKNELEFVEELARILPSATLAEFFAIPSNERRSFYEWSNNMTQFFGGASSYQDEDGIQVNNSARNLREYFRELVAKRRREPNNDFLSILLQHQEKCGLDDDELLSQAIMMLVAGQVTTTDQMCNNLYGLLTTPGLVEALRAKPEALSEVLEELNRLDPAVTFIFRVTKNDTKIGQQPIKAGDVLFISTHGVNRDPQAFSKPEHCQLTARENKHISYGFGGHFCLGAKLARIEMEMCFAELLKQFPNLQLHPEKVAKRKHHSLAFSGFEELTVVW